MGYPSALSAKTWGFSDVLFRGEPIALALDPMPVNELLAVMVTNGVAG